MALESGHQENFQSSAKAGPTFGVNPQTITWERLEAQRLERLGISNRYSRHFDAFRNKAASKSSDFAKDKSFDLNGSSSGIAVAVRTARRPRGCSVAVSQSQGKSNSLAPFGTSGKPTCGFYFTDRTDNRKKDFGIPASNLVKWRNFSAAQ